MHISEIYVYPVKSLAGMSLQAARLRRSGFEYDRQWMVVQNDGAFMTQRRYPQMALIGTAMENGRLVLSTFGMDDHTVDTADDNAQTIRTEVWGDPLSGKVHGEKTNAWLSQAIGCECRLISFADDQIRQCDPKFSASGDHTLFADAYPVLIVSRASLDNLNKKLENPVGVNRFRPNLVVEGCTPHQEDGWNTIAINGVALRNGVPCGRCSVPTVDPETGIIAGPEPIHTLSSYRQKAGEIHFGMTFIPDGAGIVRVGDPVTVGSR